MSYVSASPIVESSAPPAPPMIPSLPLDQLVQQSNPESSSPPSPRRPDLLAGIQGFNKKDLQKSVPNTSEKALSPTSALFNAIKNKPQLKKVEPGTETSTTSSVPSSPRTSSPVQTPRKDITCGENDVLNPNTGTCVNKKMYEILSRRGAIQGDDDDDEWESGPPTQKMKMRIHS